MANLKNTNIDDNLELPQGTTGQRPSSPQEGQIRYNTDLGATEFYNGSNWRPLSDTHPEAEGGTVIDTTIGGVPYRIHYFTETGTDTFTVTNPSAVDVLIVAGGGGGGGSTTSSSGSGGGGGAGGVVLKENYFVNAGSYTVTVGAGGAGTANQGINGDNSSVFGLTALGGGGGGDGLSTADGNNGGSGGGGGGDGGFAAGGTGLQPSSSSGGYGNDGGPATTSRGDLGGGGGGAGEAGRAGRTLEDRPPAGPGGNGIDFSGYFGRVIGDNGVVAGGGAGHADRRDGGIIIGGSGGGGLFDDSRRLAYPGKPFTGGGGAGGGKNGPRGAGENGGSGIVVVRYAANSKTESQPDRTALISETKNLIKQNLMLELDAGNPVSYSGSGTSVNCLADGSTTANLENGADFDTESGGAFSFDGSNDYLSTTKKFAMNDFTYAGWTKLRSQTSGKWHDIVDTYDIDSSDWARIAIRDGEFRFIFDAQSSISTVASNQTPENNRWYYVVGVRQGGTGFLYINGELENSESVSSNTIQEDSDNQIVLGNISRPSNLSEGLDGLIAAAHVYNRALSPEEVQQNFNALRGRFGI